MERIHDQLGVHVVFERRADHAGIAVSERGHRVEQMRRAAHAVDDAGGGDVVGRVGMSHRDDDVGIRNDFTDGGEILVHLRRHRNNLDHIGVLLDKRRVGLEDVLFVLRTLLLRVDERPLGVHAEDGGALPRLRLFLQAAADVDGLFDRVH